MTQRTRDRDRGDTATAVRLKSVDDLVSSAVAPTRPKRRSRHEIARDRMEKRICNVGLPGCEVIATQFVELTSVHSGNTRSEQACAHCTALVRAESDS